jgi:hypothetical protein
VSTADHWHYIPERLADALARWKAKNPGEQDQELVHEFLIDCLVNPYECSKEDDDTGVFTGTAGRNIIIVYVPNADGRIAVIDIDYA